jgi:hypothetical protein
MEGESTHRLELELAVATSARGPQPAHARVGRCVYRTFVGACAWWHLRWWHQRRVVANVNFSVSLSLSLRLSVSISVNDIDLSLVPHGKLSSAAGSILDVWPAFIVGESAPDVVTARQDGRR